MDFLKNPGHQHNLFIEHTGTDQMRILFLGSPQEVETNLRTLMEMGHQHGHELVGVITPPAKPFGRKLIMKDPPIAEFAKLNGIPLHQTPNVNHPDSIEWIRSLQTDIAITAAFGQILGNEFLTIPSRAVINIHPSLLPEYRGATPVQSVLLDRAKITGVTILFTVRSLDAGALILQRTTEIESHEKAPELTHRLFKIGSEMLFPALELLKDQSFKGTEQDPSRITHCKKITKADGMIHWESESTIIMAKFRAYWGWPGSYTFFAGKRINIIEMNIADSSITNQNSTISEKIQQEHAFGGFCFCQKSKNILVKTLQNYIKITKLQPEGSQPMEAAAFWNGIKNKTNQYFFSPSK